MANGLKNNKMLKEVCLKNLFAANGQVLADDEFPSLLRALEQNPDLVALNISGNKCLRRGVAALSTLLDHTKLERLNMSCQVIDQSEFLDLSLLVAALGRTRSLESIGKFAGTHISNVVRNVKSHLYEFLLSRVEVQQN
jgi:hypothetical protein